MADLFGQGDFQVRLDWGPVGAQATQAEIAVVVDVLSFSTSVTIAVERGSRVLPYRWKGTRAEEFAATHDAVLAIGRLEASKIAPGSAPSLSPAGLLAGPAVPRLVLPSPNGSTIAASLQDGRSTIVAGCLRNAQAVADWLSAALEAGRSVAVVAAGERWSYDDSLRPALEDHLGAGAILAALAGSDRDYAISPEALTAIDLFDASRDVLEARMRSCVGGQELRSKGFAEDVDVAAELNASIAVPVMVDGAFERCLDMQ